MMKAKILRHSAIWLCMLGILLVLGGCYHRRGGHLVDKVVREYSDKQLDSITFSATHHYTNKYNFLVSRDSLMLMSQQPEEYLSGFPVDSFAVRKNQLLVVTDIRMMPQDSIDSVWVQLAADDNSFGWTRESKMLPLVVPDDPISQFIKIFSDVHLLIFLVIIVSISAVYWMRKIFHGNARIVHFDDIDSPYPTALVIIVSVAATFYATIQTFEPDTWRHFYFHPTLNPFAVPRELGFFLATVWAMLIVGLACVDEVRERLPFSEALIYLGGLLGVCALDYIIFSILTLYFVGYVLLVAYIWFAVRAYLRHSR